MRKNYRKRLNNKGFTLVELLAVVVILAVVMGIAMTSVLSSMNNSRKGSLQNSAESTAQIFQNKYAEAMVIGNTTSVLSVTNPAFGGYNFAKSGVTVYNLNARVGSELNLSKSAYNLEAEAATATAVAAAAGTGEYTPTTSFIVFDGEHIVACLIAQNGGSYYVGQAATTAVTQKTILGQKFNFAADTMFACSDEQNSWTN